MTDWTALDRLLATDPRDTGCAHAMDVLHVYAELVAGGADAQARHGHVAAHLAVCGPCNEDLDGIVALLAQDAPRLG